MLFVLIGVVSPRSPSFVPFHSVTNSITLLHTIVRHVLYLFLPLNVTISIFPHPLLLCRLSVKPTVVSRWVSPSL